MKLLATLAFILAASAAYALDYASVSENTAILYDAPSVKAKKIFVASRYWPVEQVVALDAWVKVRDNSGGLAWIEKRALSKKRYVLVTAALAAVRQSPDENAGLVMQARQQVALEWLEDTDIGWVKVRHQDGLIGYIKTADVWGS
ncbi:MAG: SH3 domain-containing protein [Gallionellaceae bacterium]|nr:SH3 domain-containing protein [Gallionellaceae bacterium]